MGVKRVLAVIRLSNETDETTSPQRQRAVISSWIQANGHVLAGIAEDLDVSGAVSPFDRKGLGPWLARPDSFDVIACWKLDRLSRKVVHFSQLMDWCDQHRKTIVSVTEGVDMATPMGRMFAHIIAAFAQGERETITERLLGSHAKLRQEGRYAGAPWPMGYMAADRPGGGKTLAQEPVYAAHLRRMVRDVTDGVSSYELARRLNAEGVRTWGWRRAQLSGRVLRAKGGKVDLTKQTWSADVVQQVLKNPACAGFKVSKLRGEDGERYLRGNEIVRDADDEPVMATDEPVVTAAEWRAAVAALAGRANPGERTARTESMLQGVIVCASCGGTMYQHRMTKKVRGEAKTYAYYRCQSDRRARGCEHPAAVAVEAAEEAVSTALLHLLDGQEITRTEYEPGEDYAAQITEARERLEALEDDYLAGKYDGETARASYQRLVNKLGERIEKLEALPHRSAAVRLVGTGQTYGERWRECDRLERRAFLIEQGFRVFAAAAGQLCHGPHCDQPCRAPEFHGEADLIDADDLWCCTDDRDRPNRKAHVRLVMPPTVWKSVRDGVELPPGADPLEGSWTFLEMTPRVPPGASLGRN